MTKEEILMWNKRYDDEEDLYNTGLEKELGKKFRRNKFITKKDLEKIIEWKFQEVKGRQLSNLKRLRNFYPGAIEKISKLVFEIDSDDLRIKLLTVIDGVGPAVASVILTFYDPKNCGIFDIHVWRELYGRESKYLFTQNNYLKVLTDLRKIARQYNLTVRTVEKALFEKNKSRIN